MSEPSALTDRVRDARRSSARANPVCRGVPQRKTSPFWLPTFAEERHAHRERAFLAASPITSRATLTKARSAGETCARLGKYRKNPGTAAV